jgi:hypothetical protein
MNRRERRDRALRDVRAGATPRRGIRATKVGNDPTPAQRPSKRLHGRTRYGQKRVQEVARRAAAETAQARATTEALDPLAQHRMDRVGWWKR